MRFSVFALPLASASQVVLHADLLDDSGHQTCPADSLSCEPGAKDSCCYEATNGLVLLTQFWDYSPPIGEDDEFTIHGLWPDKCDGSYNQFCNSGMQVHSIVDALKARNETALLAQMYKSWIPLDGNFGNFWGHEFNKHATCLHTLWPECYGASAQEYQNVVDYFQTAVELWRNLPTHEWLTAAGYAPSMDAELTVAEVEAVLSARAGAQVFLGCDAHGALNEIWYAYKLRGPLSSGKLVPVDAPRRSSCKDGFRWVPKGKRAPGVPPPPTRPPPSGDKGYLTLRGQDGCLISNGHWYVGGQCATYTLSESTYGGYALTSSKGPCDVLGGVFTCAKGLAGGQFEVADGVVQYGGQNWSASYVPAGTRQAAVYSGPHGPVEFALEFEAR